MYIIGLLRYQDRDFYEEAASILISLSLFRILQFPSSHSLPFFCGVVSLLLFHISISISQVPGFLNTSIMGLNSVKAGSFPGTLGVGSPFLSLLLLLLSFIFYFVNVYTAYGLGS